MATASRSSPRASTGADWVRHAEAEIKAAGHRASTARSAVVAVLGGQRCVLTARQVADELRDRGNDVGMATIYRALELLEELRLVQRLDTGEGTARFEPALPSGDHHHHFVCDRCGRVGAFEDATLERAIERLAQRLDYDVAGHDVILRGNCSGCAVDAYR